MITAIVNPEQYVLPDLLDSEGTMRLMPSSYYDEFEPVALQIWGHQNARYGFPTVELVAWLKERIGDRHAIEIGSGAGDLCKHLGIQGTDYKVQEKRWVKEHYKERQQTLIEYPSWVKRREALAAIEQYDPSVVVASWVTQYLSGNIAHEPGAVGCIHGVKEEELLATGVEYIFIGNRSVHAKKRILALPHEEYKLPFIRSRAAYPDQNLIWIWKGHNDQRRNS